jgi:signal transduction histidine kinase
MVMRVGTPVAPVTVAVALASIALTAAVRLNGVRLSERDGWWNLAELSALLVLIALSARAGRPLWAVAACCTASTAVTVWLLRFAKVEDPWILLAPVAGAAVAVGAYLRAVDNRRTAAVADARRAQRLSLARDLHDYVAHDISEMVALAQAGQVLVGDGTAQVRDVLARIERAGVAGLESMDRTVRMLHDQPSVTPARSLADVHGLAERFRATGVVAVRLDIAPGVPRDLGPTVYRVVSEALTNVRRHATTATRVDVRVHHDRDRVVIGVTDDACDRPATTPPRGGFGLAGLAAGVEALGGTFVAGPGDPHGWIITVVLPRNAAR